MAWQASAGPVSSSPTAVVIDPISDESSLPYLVEPQPFRVGVSPVTVPMQLQQSAEQAERTLAQIEARRAVSVLDMPAAGMGLRMHSSYELAAGRAVSFVDLAADASAPRPVVPLPASAWGGIAALGLLVIGWRMTRPHRRRPIRVRR
ncbi:MAG: hypothetical protein AAF656_04620 [Planctomycetota bacterium]